MLGYVGFWAITAACGQTGRLQPTATQPSPLQPSTPGTLVIESYTVVEFRYSPTDSLWRYAPLVRVSRPAADGAATVTSMAFTVPGVGAASLSRTDVRVEAGQSRDLLQDTYGDYALTIDRANARATGEPAAMTLTYRTDSGATARVTAQGTVVPGGPPTTCTGGPVDPPCR